MSAAVPIQHCTPAPVWQVHPALSALPLHGSSLKSSSIRSSGFRSHHDHNMQHPSLLCVHGPSLVASEPSTLRAALQAQASSHSKGHGSRLYVYAPDHVRPTATQQLLSLLSQLYGEVGAVDPQLDVVPLLPFAGWTPDAVAQMPDLRSIITSSGDTAAGQQLLQALAERRPAGLPPLQLVHLGPVPPHSRASDSNVTSQPPSEKQPPVHADASSHDARASSDAEPRTSGTAASARHTAAHEAVRAAEQSETSRSVAGEQRDVLSFRKVAVGGTFDRLHAGHRLLLAATALVATENAFVGITADALLAKKANKELLQHYDERLAAVLDFVLAVRPALVMSHAPLSDSQAPTQAELDSAMEALVVSQETLPGGQAINAGRRSRGFAELALVVVELVGGDAAGGKLSSTALRSKDAGQH